MFRRRPPTTVLLAAVIPTLLGIVGCGDDEHPPAMVEPGEVYVAIIRWELSRLDDGTGTSVAATDGTDLPIVYVVTADGSEISAGVQASVAAATVDDATVRFADSRDQVLDTDADDQPVSDDAVLLSVQQVESGTVRRLTTDVVVYHSLTDQQSWVLTVEAAGEGATITSSSVQPT